MTEKFPSWFLRYRFDHTENGRLRTRRGGEAHRGEPSSPPRRGFSRFTRGSVASEDRLARPLLDETAHPDLLVLGGEQGGELCPLDLQSGVQVGLQPSVHGLLGRGQG